MARESGPPLIGSLLQGNQPMRMRMLAAMPILMLWTNPVLQSSMFDGRPAFSQKVDLAYYVWREGDTWHVRWTTKGRMRTFTGSVSATGGELSSFKRIDVDSERKVMYGRGMLLTITSTTSPARIGGRAPVFNTGADGQITFDARTENDIDGFDFKAEDVEQLQLDLQIDGSALPSRVAVGRKNEKASKLPLVFTLK